MSNRVLHKQLASIMEVLANSAVAEICKVVDDGYAVLRLEISQSKKENDALRRKLQVMERRLLHGRPEKTKMRESPVHPRCDGPHLYSEMKGTTVPEESYFSLDQQMADIPRRAGKANALAEKGSSVHLIGDQCADVEEGRTELVLIKEETVEEDPQGEMKNEEQVPEESYFSLDQQMADIPRRARKANALAEKGSPVHLIGDQCADVEEGRTELVLIKEETVEEDPQGEMKNEEQGAVEWRAGSREKHPVEETQNKAANHTEELTEQHRTRRAVWEVSGLESVLKAEGQSECVETLQHRGAEHRAGGLNSLDSEFVMFERPGQLGSYCTQEGAVTETEDPCCSYSTEMGPQSLSFHSELPSVGSGNSLSDDSSSCASHVQIHTRKKVLICGFCGKGFNRPTKLEIHQRIHTGEKPFSCSVCGKRFAQSCNLNRHKIVHTGEKPFSCMQCGKRFARSCHLKMHQRVHARGRPYSCNRFSEKRSLRIQPHRKHTGI